MEERLNEGDAAQKASATDKESKHVKAQAGSCQMKSTATFKGLTSSLTDMSSGNIKKSHPLPNLSMFQRLLKFQTSAVPTPGVPVREVRAGDVYTAGRWSRWIGSRRCGRLFFPLCPSGHCRICQAGLCLCSAPWGPPWVTDRPCQRPVLGFISPGPQGILNLAGVRLGKKDIGRMVREMGWLLAGMGERGFERGEPRKGLSTRMGKDLRPVRL